MSPTCLQSIVAAVRRPPPPWTDRHLEDAPSPARQSAQACPSGKTSPPSAAGSAESSVLERHRRPACLPFPIQRCGALFINVKKENHAASQLFQQMMVKGKLLPPPSTASSSLVRDRALETRVFVSWALQGETLHPLPFACVPMLKYSAHVLCALGNPRGTHQLTGTAHFPNS